MTAIQKTDDQPAAWKDFSVLVRRAEAYAKSKLIPVAFQDNVANCIMALELAERLRISEMAVMQNLYVVHGKPGWSSQFLIACINASGNFSKLRFRVTPGEKKGDIVCVAYAIDRETKELIEGPPVSLEMAKAEGWSTKSGSKWQTMPDLMLRYRAATFFARLYAPEVTIGFVTAEEAEDLSPVRAAIEQVSPFTRDEEPEQVPEAPSEPDREPGEDDL